MAWARSARLSLALRQSPLSLRCFERSAACCDNSLLLPAAGFSDKSQGLVARNQSPEEADALVAALAEAGVAATVQEGGNPPTASPRVPRTVPPRKGAAGSDGAAAGEEDELYPCDREVDTPRGGSRGFTVVLPCPAAAGAGHDEEVRSWMGASTSAWKRCLRTRDAAGLGGHAGGKLPFGWDTRGWDSEEESVAVGLSTALLGRLLVLARRQTQRDAQVLARRLQAEGFAGARVSGPGPARRPRRAFRSRR